MIGQTLAFKRRIVDTGQNTPARRIVFDLIEQHRRRRIGLRRDFGHRADLLVPIGAFDDSQLAERIDATQPLAQISIVHSLLP